MVALLCWLRLCLYVLLMCVKTREFRYEGGDGKACCSVMACDGTGGGSSIGCSNVDRVC